MPHHASPARCSDQSHPAPADRAAAVGGQPPRANVRRTTARARSRARHRTRARCAALALALGAACTSDNGVTDTLRLHGRDLATGAIGWVPRRDIAFPP